MPVTGSHIGIASVQVEVALRLVETHGRQAASLGVSQKAVAARLIAQACVAQALAALLRVLRTLLNKVVEWLVVVLEVGDLGDPVRALELLQRGLPGPRVPGPVNVLFAQFVADMLMALWHQYAWQVGLGIVGTLGVADPGRPVRRRHGVDCKTVRSKSAGTELRGAGHGAGRGFVQRLQACTGRVIALQNSNLRLGNRGIRVRIERHRCADQVLVVKERTAKSPLEEVVAQYEFTGYVPQTQRILRLGVVAHGQAAGIPPGHELVVLAIVDLHLVLIEHMPQVAGHQIQRQILLIRPFQREGGVGQVLLKLLTRRIGHAIYRLRSHLQQPAPYRWQGL